MVSKLPSNYFNYKKGENTRIVTSKYRSFSEIEILKPNQLNYKLL